MQKPLDWAESFVPRHVGPSDSEVQGMLKTIGLKSLEELVRDTIPEKIRFHGQLDVGRGLSENEVLAHMSDLAAQNEVFRSFIGLGYSDCVTPSVIQRNILENPGWYTQYTPYQSEISQGRLEALLNFQTMIMDLTKMEVTNASLLDEATAAAEAMFLSWNAKGKSNGSKFFVSDRCHPQTVAVVQTRAKYLGIQIEIGKVEALKFSKDYFGCLVQYPNTDGIISDYSSFVKSCQENEIIVTFAADLLALALITPPGEMGADIVVGSCQRFGVGLGFGGPHAAYFATKDKFKRLIPGRIVGVSVDARGKKALRLALQTREQHIRRERATSNICTSQVLLAIMAGMYGVYHGPEGIKRIATRIYYLTSALRLALTELGFQVHSDKHFDSLKVSAKDRDGILARARAQRINLRDFSGEAFGISLDETTSEKDLVDLVFVFSGKENQDVVLKSLEKLKGESVFAGLGSLKRKSEFMTHPVFNTHHSETEMLRYINRLMRKDLSLTTSMIPLGSCTMKLNATTEMLPVTWPRFMRMHPFAPATQTQGYLKMFKYLEKALCDLTGFDGASLQPNAGSQGEYSGLLVIRKYQEDRGEGHRDVCLIPSSAHGTNPATANIAGMKVVVVACDDQGNIDFADLKNKAEEHKANLSALMITYPSTHGVFEESVREICDVIHKNGGQVYMDGANMNAQIGLCRPGEFGPDVCHLNLHKTFCIPHGGGGPGMGPICVKSHLVDLLPNHPLVAVGGKKGMGAVSAAPWGSAAILPISYSYILMMGAEGLKFATQVAILNANYMAQRLKDFYPVLYKGKSGRVAHECILDLRALKDASGVTVEDVAKRLMDYGFHAPTVSFPVPGTLMVEPTESENRAELDRFCDAMIEIRKEIQEIIDKKADAEQNVLKLAPHTVEDMVSGQWTRPYSKEKAVFPLKWVQENKFWPPVARINNPFGDRNLVCACPPMEEYN